MNISPRFRIIWSILTNIPEKSRLFQTGTGIYRDLSSYYSTDGKTRKNAVFFDRYEGSVAFFLNNNIVITTRKHMRKIVSSGSHLEDPIGFSRACRIGDYISVSGTAPIKNGETVHINDVYNQTKYCLELSITAIEEAGGHTKDVIRTRIMLTDISRWEEAAKAHGELFSTIKPACTFVEVSRFIDERWLVETEIDCVVM